VLNISAKPKGNAERILSSDRSGDELSEQLH
jgi:hypothetical protein